MALPAVRQAAALPAAAKQPALEPGMARQRALDAVEAVVQPALEQGLQQARGEAAAAETAGPVAAQPAWARRRVRDAVLGELAIGEPARQQPRQAGEVEAAERAEVRPAWVSAVPRAPDGAAGAEARRPWVPLRFWVPAVQPPRDAQEALDALEHPRQ